MEEMDGMDWRLRGTSEREWIEGLLDSAFRKFMFEIGGLASLPPNEGSVKYDTWLSTLRLLPLILELGESFIPLLSDVYEFLGRKPLIIEALLGESGVEDKPRLPCT